MPGSIRSLLIANRGEIAMRIIRAASELGIRTVSIYAHEERGALHRFQADESYLVGAGRTPIAAYLDINDILRIARQTGVDAMHPGYGFLAEHPEFAEACEQAGVEFVGPRSEVLRILGNKVAARALAHTAGVGILPATGPLPRDIRQAQEMATQIGYPLMLKASWGGGGRGMRVVESAHELATLMDGARRETLAAFGNDEVYLEKLVRRAHHVEVQILGDLHGTLVHLFERDCSVQRRHQKVVEQAPAPYVSDHERRALCTAALTLASAASYTHAGTVEFLMDVDMSGIAAASVFAAIDAGVDAVYGALDAMSGLTAQPNLSAIAAALAGTDQDPGLDPDALQALSHYWEVVRQYYAPFETDMRAGTAGVYHHEMPGPQYTNLREQVRGMGLEHRWAEICHMYAEVNLLFGDIVKITPTSTAVADLAMYMVANGLTPEDVQQPERDISFPRSVVALLRGDVGTPPEGFPLALQRKVLKGERPLYGRAADFLPEVDLIAQRHTIETLLARPVNERELVSYLLFPRLFQDYARYRMRFGEVARLPTPAFFYGLRVGEEITVDLERGKALIISLQGRTEPDDAGDVTLFFALNGQPYIVKVLQAGIAVTPTRPRAQEDNPTHIGATMAGLVVTVLVQSGQHVTKGDPLLSIEAMKMDMQLVAERTGTIAEVCVQPGDRIQPCDLLVTLV